MNPHQKNKVDVSVRTPITSIPTPTGTTKTLH
jgi:hypothetical protein